eukprot:TRINITY_DN33057_c0_g1_i1.p1 TRINITY_DN33057_c0_g1~~TRINITY_DN33057_c0_g1_i1.p1  ORF type:complete len:159 (-),score=35.37 TRINITY_DN33057_c0_g1_i1:99-575(-)
MDILVLRHQMIQKFNQIFMDFNNELNTSGKPNNNKNQFTKGLTAISSLFNSQLEIFKTIQIQLVKFLSDQTYIQEQQQNINQVTFNQQEKIKFHKQKLSETNQLYEEQIQDKENKITEILNQFKKKQMQTQALLQLTNLQQLKITELQQKIKLSLIHI